MFRKSIFLIVTLLALLPSVVFAVIPNPDSYQVSKAYIYEDVLVEGDALYLASFDLEYGITPVDSNGNDVPITDTWQGMLLDDVPSPGISTIFSLASFYADVNPTSGYNEGVFGIYEEEQTAVTGTLKICLNKLDSSLRRCASSISSITSDTELKEILITIFEDLEKEWRVLDNAASPEDSLVDLIEPTGDIRKTLTLMGEDYAVNMIANLHTISPDFFASGIVTPTIVEEAYDTTVTDDFEDFFDGTELDSTPGAPSALNALSTWLKIPVAVIGMAAVLGVAAAIAFYVITAVGRPEIGLFSGIMVIQVGAYVGLVDFAIAAILAMLGALALGYIFFYKSSTS
tara:strand:- start:441 stop:1472 length:1032 start_codon:yes stop_codon:yes gene_type:complete